MGSPIRHGRKGWSSTRKPEEVRRALARQWLAKAEEDLAVPDLIARNSGPLYGALCFHAQQAAEKALKAGLGTQQTEFGRTHDIACLPPASEPPAPGITEALPSARAWTPDA